MSLNNQFVSNDGQKESYHCNAKSNCCPGINILKNRIKVFFCGAFHVSFFKIYAPNNAIIPKAILVLKSKILRLRAAALSGIKAAANQAADKLEKISERTVNKIGSIFITNTLTTVQKCFNQ